MKFDEQLIIDKKYFTKNYVHKNEENFVESYGIALEKSLDVTNTEHVLYALNSGFKVSYQYTRSASVEVRKPVLKEIAQRIVEYFNGEPSSDWCDFSNKLRFWRGILINNLNMNVGRAQKTINMAFKYMYCFDNASKYEYWFKYCHMPLDSKILDWYEEWYVKVFGLKKCPVTKWTLICSDIEYSEIQNNIHLYLCVANYKLTIPDEIHLDSNSLKSEFVIWPDRLRIEKKTKK